MLPRFRTWAVAGQMYFFAGEAINCRQDFLIISRPGRASVTKSESYCSFMLVKPAKEETKAPRSTDLGYGHEDATAQRDLAHGQGNQLGAKIRRTSPYLPRPQHPLQGCALKRVMFRLSQNPETKKQFSFLRPRLATKVGKGSVFFVLWV